jgi:hypothetical protein
MGSFSVIIVEDFLLLQTLKFLKLVAIENRIVSDYLTKYKCLNGNLYSSWDFLC